MAAPSDWLARAARARLMAGGRRQAAGLALAALVVAFYRALRAGASKADECGTGGAAVLSPWPDRAPALSHPMMAPRASQLLFLHARLAAALGVPPGVADVGALAAALQDAAATGSDLFEQAAALAAALARRHPFYAANLALAAAAAGLFLRAYDLELQLTVSDAPALRAHLTAGDRAVLAAWLRARTTPRPLE